MCSVLGIFVFPVLVKKISFHEFEVGWTYHFAVSQDKICHFDPFFFAKYIMIGMLCYLSTLVDLFCVIIWDRQGKSLDKLRQTFKANVCPSISSHCCYRSRNRIRMISTVVSNAPAHRCCGCHVLVYLLVTKMGRWNSFAGVKYWLQTVKIPQTFGEITAVTEKVSFNFC